MDLQLRLLDVLSIAPFVPGHNLSAVRSRPGSYDVVCTDDGCELTFGLIVSETTHSSYKGNHDGG